MELIERDVVRRPTRFLSNYPRSDKIKTEKRFRLFLTRCG